MGLFRVLDGDVTFDGKVHRSGATIAFEGVPVPVELAPLDEEARRQKLARITAEVLDNAARYPQRAKLLARLANGSTLDDRSGNG